MGLRPRQHFPFHERTGHAWRVIAKGIYRVSIEHARYRASSAPGDGAFVPITLKRLAMSSRRPPAKTTHQRQLGAIARRSDTAHAVLERGQKLEGRGGFAIRRNLEGRREGAAIMACHRRRWRGSAALASKLRPPTKIRSTKPFQGVI
jgi:hypothetical protein